MMKTVAKIPSLFFLLVFVLLSACVGGVGLEGGGGELPSSGGGAVGQGQPTIQPGPDHQPGVPIEEEGGLSASNELTFPPPPPPEPSEEPEGPDGPSSLTY